MVLNPSTRSILYPFFCILIFQVSGLCLTDSLRYDIQHYTDEQGLPQNSINGIGVDEYGFVWLATEGGITRYDGRSFEVYNSSKLGLNTKRIAYLSYDYQSKRLSGISSLAEKFPLMQGRPWHMDSTLTYLDEVPETDISPRYAIGLPPYYPEPGFEIYQIDAKNGGDFMISHDSILYYDHTRKIKSRIAFPYDNFFRFFLLDQELFHLTFTGQAYKIELDGTVKDIAIKGDLVRDNKDLEKIKLYWNFATGEVFMYVDRSFYTVSISKNKLRTKLILDDFDFDKQNIFSAHYDKNHKRIFLGSKTNGLFVLTRKKFRTMSGGNLLEEHMFYGQAPYGEDKVLTTQGYIFSDTGLVDTKYNLREATRDRRSMLRDSKGFFWTTRSWKSLYKFSPDLSKMLLRKETPDPISCIQESMAGEILLGTYSGGVIEYEPERDTFRHLYSTNNEIVCIQQTAADTLLIGTLQSGVLRLHIPSGRVDSLPGLGGKSIRSIYQDKARNLWITTYNDGFYLYQNKKLVQFPLDRDRHLSSTHCILEDQSGYFWISTNNGLFQVKKQHLIDYASDTTAKPHYIYYNKDSGFNTNEFNGGCQPCAIKTGNGYFSFPSMNGLVWFHPEEVTPEVPDQKIIIDDFAVDGKAQSLEDTIVAEHGFNQIKIDIATAYFGNPYNLHMEYQIKHGKNDNVKWFPLENEAIFLNDLQSGVHEVVVRKVNFIDSTGYDYASIFIAVPPFYYETWAFMGICFMVLLFLLWALYTWRSNRIRTQNLQLQQKIDSQTHSLQEYVSELERSESNLIKQTHLLEHLSAAISHDVNSPLSFIVHSLKNISEKLSKEDHQLAIPSQTTYTSILQVYDYVNNLTKHTSTYLTTSKQKTENINLYDLVQERIEFFSPLAHQKGNKLINTIDSKYELWTNADLLVIILHNLIDNANKHSAAGTITVSALLMKDGLHLNIVDTGAGMDPKQVQAINSLTPVNFSENGLGLHIVQYLTTILEGHFTIKSQPGKGTTATLFFRANHSI